jgi:hypothetical protein
MKAKIVIGVLYVVVAGLFFYGGYAVGHKGNSSSAASQTATRAAGSTTGTTGAAGSYAGRRSGAAGAAGANFGGGVTGQIISMDSSSITVKTQAGSTAIVYYSGTTAVTKEQTATASDLAVGQNVVVRGTNSSGTVTATNISVVPTLPTMPAGAAGASGGNSSANGSATSSTGQ